MDIVEYSKELIPRDIAERLYVPEGWMVILRQLFMNGGNEAQVRALDWRGMSWVFRCSTRSNGRYDKPTFQSLEWKKFVHYAGLQVGDRIILRQNNDEANFRELRFAIIAQRKGVDGLWANVELPQHAAPAPAPELLPLFR